MFREVKKPLLALLAAALPLAMLLLPENSRALAVGTSGSTSSSTSSSSSPSSAGDDEDDRGWPWTIPEDNATDKFWADILQKIRTAKEGKVIEVDARKTDYIVPRVITELKEYGVIVKVTFRSAISGDKLTVTLNKDTVKPVEPGVLYYPWKEFEKLYLPPEASGASSKPAAAHLSPVTPPSSSVPPAAPSSVPEASSQDSSSSQEEAESSPLLPAESQAPPADGQPESNAATGPLEQEGVLSVGTTLAIGGILSLVILGVGLLGGRRRAV